MICYTSREVLSEIKKYMDLNDISMKTLALNMHKSQQSVSQIFQNGNPKVSTLLEICNALNICIDFKFIDKSDVQ